MALDKKPEKGARGVGQTERLEVLLDEARKRLVDTGTRNRLVHTNRKSKRPATLALVHPDPDAVFQRLLIDKSSFRFIADLLATKRERQQNPEDGPEDVISDQVELLAAPCQDGLLQTRLGEGGLQKKLTRLYREAKTLEEEQGVNILFLAMGFLQWYEDDESKILREGPLVLIPVSLVRDTKRSTYTLKAREEDITTNLPLAERLRDQEGIAFPEIPEGEDWLLSSYFEKVSDAVSSRVRWSIDRKGIELGFFSFAKLLMYRDLGPGGWPNASILSHLLLRRLLQDGFPHEEPLYPDDIKIDERFQPADLVHVLDADGSQTLAIETARAGRNLVIQGPPGTGKSQTIANIIASAVHDGKSVLFIAEKMVALKVVHDRLRDAGLGALCLQIHSNKANKRELAEELNRTLSSGAAEPGVADVTPILTETRDTLNRIARDLHAPIGATGLSAFRALADLIRAKGFDLPPPSYSVPEMASWTNSVYETVSKAAETYARTIRTSGPVHSHPWRGVRNAGLEPTDLDRIAEAGPRVAAELRELAKTAALISPYLQIDWQNSLAGIGRLIRFIELLACAPESCADAVAQLHPLSASQLARTEEMIGEAASILTGLAAWAGTFYPAALEADAAIARARLAAGTSWFKRWKKKYRDASAELASWLTEPIPKSAAERVSLVDRLIDLQAKIKRFEKLSASAQTLFGFLWRGQATDLSRLRSVASWLRCAREEGFGFDLTPSLMLLERPDLIREYLVRLHQVENSARTSLEAIISRLDLDQATAFGVPSVNHVPLEVIALRIDEWAEHVGRYSEWSTIANADGTLRNNGHSALANQIADGAMRPETAVEELRHASVIHNYLSCATKTERNLLRLFVGTKPPGANWRQPSFARAMR
jgi:hypothetical protein